MLLTINLFTIFLKKIYLLLIKKNRKKIFSPNSDYPTQPEKQFCERVLVMWNPGRPLLKSDEAVAANKRKRALEQYSANRKRLLREKQKKAVAAAVPVDQGEAEDTDDDPVIIVSHHKQLQNHFK